MLPKPKQPQFTTGTETQTQKAVPHICDSNPSPSGESMFGGGVSTKIPVWRRCSLLKSLN